MSQRTRYFMIGSALVIVLGLGVGAVAYYNGNLPLTGRGGPAEFAYLPADVNGVAYANVTTIMNSQFTQRLRQVLPTGDEKTKLQAELGIDIERDIDSVVAGTVGFGPDEHGLVLVRGRFNTGHLEALAVQHGGTAQEYKGKKLITFENSPYAHVGGGAGDQVGHSAVAFLEGGLLAFGDRVAIERAIDASATRQNVTGNADLMKLVGEVQAGSDAWVVGNFEAISRSKTLPTEVATHLPAVQWFAVSANFNGGVNGTVRAEARDEKAAEELKAVVNGALAAGRLVSGQDKRIEAMLNALQVSGMGKSVTISFTVPPEILDIINGVAAAKHLSDGSGTKVKK
jgi:hypothetical protein